MYAIASAILFFGLWEWLSHILSQTSRVEPVWLAGPVNFLKILDITPTAISRYIPAHCTIYRYHFSIPGWPRKLLGLFAWGSGVEPNEALCSIQIRLIRVQGNKSKTMMPFLKSSVFREELSDCACLTCCPHGPPTATSLVHHSKITHSMKCSICSWYTLTDTL